MNCTELSMSIPGEATRLLDVLRQKHRDAYEKAAQQEYDELVASLTKSADEAHGSEIRTIKFKTNLTKIQSQGIDVYQRYFKDGTPIEDCYWFVWNSNCKCPDDALPLGTEPPPTATAWCNVV